MSERVSPPPSRVAAFDLARGLAMAFMVMVHVLMTYGDPEVQDSPFGWVIDFLGSPPAAPVFMFLMGASMAFSTRTGLAKGVRRGLWLLFLGYLLNFLRGSLPVWVALRAGMVTQEEIAPYTPLYEFLTVDILQFAGVALIVFAVLRRFTTKPAHWIALAIAVMLVSPLLWGKMTGWMPLDQVLRLLWGAEGEAAAFPAFPWLCYPLLGMAFGKWLAASEDRGRVFRGATWAGLALLAVGTAVTLTDPDFHIQDYYRSGPGAVIWIAGFVLVWLRVCHAAASRIRPNPAFRLLDYWSRHVTTFYFIHWVILGWGVALVGHQERRCVATILLMPLVALLADQATRLWVGIRGGHGRARTATF